MRHRNDGSGYTRLGVLAFGSLLENAGELDAVTVERVPAQTPFPVEYARSSKDRGGAPTLVPVAHAGANVQCQVLVLDPLITIEEARNRLYRRETNRVRGDVVYTPKARPSRDGVVILELEGFAGCDVVLYTSIGTNIDPVDGPHLAALAVSSAKTRAGDERRDGISYLAGAMRNGVITPLTTAYEEAILHLTGTSTLEQAWQTCRDGASARS
jgi:hypothetical protein